MQSRGNKEKHKAQSASEQKPQKKTEAKGTSWRRVTWEALATTTAAALTRTAKKRWV